MSAHFERFTAEANEALRLAQDEAQRFHHNYVGTEHLLLGLLRVPEATAARVLLNLGVEPPKIRTAVEFIIGRGERPVVGEVGLTVRAKRVIELAIDEARRLGATYVGTEHLLLGLVREGEGIAAGVLASLRVDLDAVRHEVTRLAADGGASGGSSERSAGPAARGLPSSQPAARQRAGSASPYEATIGFSRAVRVGGRVLVSGTAPIWPDGHVDSDPSVQAERCFEIILAALAELGGEAYHVVRTRMYIVDPAVADAVGAVHGRLLGEARPAATMVVVAALLDPRWKVEIEAEALIGS